MVFERMERDDRWIYNQKSNKNLHFNWYTCRFLKIRKNSLTYIALWYLRVSCSCYDPHILSFYDSDWGKASLCFQHVVSCKGEESKRTTKIHNVSEGSCWHTVGWTLLTFHWSNRLIGSSPKSKWLDVCFPVMKSHDSW